VTALRIAARQWDLTEREHRVLRLIADGKDTDEIAAELHYAERTVKNIAHDVLLKLGARNRAHAVAIALEQGVLVPRDKIGMLTKQYIAHLEQERDHYRAKLERVKRALQ
jgi:DNA-binding CsgD family transcriptional regulator